MQRDYSKYISQLMLIFFIAVHCTVPAVSLPETPTHRVSSEVNLSLYSYLSFSLENLSTQIDNFFTRSSDQQGIYLEPSQSISVVIEPRCFVCDSLTNNVATFYSLGVSYDAQLYHKGTDLYTWRIIPGDNIEFYTYASIVEAFEVTRTSARPDVWIRDDITSTARTTPGSTYFTNAPTRRTSASFDTDNQWRRDGSTNLNSATSKEVAEFKWQWIDSTRLSTEDNIKIYLYKISGEAVDTNNRWQWIGPTRLNGVNVTLYSAAAFTTQPAKPLFHSSTKTIVSLVLDNTTIQKLLIILIYRSCFQTSYLIPLPSVPEVVQVMQHILTQIKARIRLNSLIHKSDLSLPNRVPPRPWQHTYPQRFLFYHPETRTEPLAAEHSDRHPLIGGIQGFSTVSQRC